MRRSLRPAGKVGEKSMRNDKRRWLPAVLAGLCALLLSGCNALGLDVEDYLRPPKSTGEQEAIQQALETYIEAHAEKGGVTDYILKYPKEGAIVRRSSWSIRCSRTGWATCRPLH